MLENTVQPWALQKGYLLGWRFDSTFIFGVLLLALSSGFLVLFNPELFDAVLFIDLWLLGYHHVIATFTKLIGTVKDRAENNFLIYKLPFLVLGAVMLLNYLAGIWMLVTIYFFWQWYHYTRQSYGVSVFYRRKSDIKESTTPVWLDYIAIWAIPAWGIIYRCSQGWDSFLFLPIWTPVINPIVSVVAGAFACAITAAWLITKLVDYSKGNLFYGQFFFMVSHYITFYIGYIYIDDINNGWLVANIWHNSQYILFVWLFNQNKFKNNNADGSSVLSWLSQPDPARVFAYFGACIIITSFIYHSFDYVIFQVSNEDLSLVTSLSIIVYQTLNFHHYIVDSLIWKARKKSHQEIMRLKG